MTETWRAVRAGPAIIIRVKFVRNPTFSGTPLNLDFIPAAGTGVLH
jgi:hypothetical protein